MTRKGNFCALNENSNMIMPFELSQTKTFSALFELTKALGHIPHSRKHVAIL